MLKNKGEHDVSPNDVKIEVYGILIRYFDKPGLRDHIRITVGKPEHTDAILKAIKTITGGEA